MLEEWIDQRSGARVMFDHETCAVCDQEGYKGYRVIQLGIWNPGRSTLVGVRVFVQSIDDGLVHKRELHGLGMAVGEPLTLSPTTAAGHTHLNFLVVTPSRTAQLQVRDPPHFPKGPTGTLRLLVEGTDVRPAA